MLQHSLRTLYFRHIQSTSAKFLITAGASYHHSNFPKTLRRPEPVKKPQHPKLQTAEFCTTCGWLSVSPHSVLFVSTTLPYGSFVLGLCLRFWWLRQSGEQQEKYKRWFAEKKNILFGSVCLFSLSVLIYYLTHFERDPIEKRRRFIIFNKAEQAMIGNLGLAMLLARHREQLIPRDDPRYKTLSRIVQNIAFANKDAFPERSVWTINIINDPYPNAMVLPGGNIFVFTGCFDVSENDDQLSFILAHELSHVILLHTIELVSYTVLKDFLYAIPTVLIWACLSKWKALILHLGIDVIYKLVFLFPYKRRLENEADETCADLREILVFWRIMGKLSDMTGENKYLAPWLLTHPDSKYREENLARRMPGLLKLREELGCPRLPAEDPRKKFDERSRRDLEARFRSRGLI